MFNIQEELKKLPEKPGVYIMKDKDDNILYVGKAVVLKNRVRQYFQKTNKTERIKKMVSQIDHFEYIVVDNEMEALILECNLIKLHRPKYNVLLKDDKMYPYIKIAINEYFPTVRITRKRLNDGAKYFGPFTNAYATKETVEYLNKVYKLKHCRKVFKKGRYETPCLNYHIKRCMGLCKGEISRDEYMKSINEVIAILEGKANSILLSIEEEMNKESEKLNFEKAAELRDKLACIENLLEKQKIDSYNENDLDVIAVVKILDKACIEVFSVRNSRMQNGENFIFKDISSETEEELLENFIKQYYIGDNVPAKIMFKYNLENQDLIREWLQKISGKKSIELKVPKIGEKMRFIEMAEKNAQIALQNRTTAIDDEEVLLDLMELLKLDELPIRIESYDISNISGTNQVAGIVVFENAKPKKSEYRRLKIKTIVGQDDPGSLKETLERRYKYIAEPEEDKKNPFGRQPNLILMDGGITQIRAAIKVLSDYGLDIPTFGMVKDNKHHTRALLDKDGKEYDISKNQKLFNFVTFMQDEVHNLAINYHRKLRDQEITKSELDEIIGIGEKRKKALLEKFKSVNRIKEASIEDLCSVQGITREIAIRLKNM